MNDYKPLARRFLEDHRVFAEWKQIRSGSDSAADLKNASAKVRALEGKLKMPGALRDALKEETKRLNTRLAEREKAEKQARDAENVRVLELETPLWNAALANARKQTAGYDFAGALTTIDSAQVTEASLRQAQAAERKKIAWLAEWKATLIADLKTGRYTGRITDLPAVEYEGVVGATQEEITLRIPGNRGSASVKWTALKPQTLLAISAAFFQTSPPEAADRQWFAAVFAHETSQAEQATHFADAAAKAKPSYRAELDLFKGPPGRAR